MTTSPDQATRSSPLPIKVLPLAGWNILVVEPRFLIAADIAATIARAGGAVVGPYRRKAEAFAAIVGNPGLQGAVLATMLPDGRPFDLVHRLIRCRIPCVFHTGLPHGMIPATLAGVPYCCKPCPADDLLTAMLDADHAARGPVTRAA